MFTGLIEEIGRVRSLRRGRAGALLTVETAIDGLVVGESIAVNGACQTVTAVGDGAFSCDVLAETLRVTNLGLLRPGASVNLERALGVGDRLGGHIVSGHVDGLGTVTAVSKNPRGLTTKSAK